jgi:hypothetical protein
MRLSAWVTLLALACAGATSARTDDWTTYSAGAYGFSMLAPADAKFAEKEFDGGWGGMHASCEGVELYGLACLGLDASAEDIEKFGVKATGIGAARWEQIDSGKNKNGWRWYRTVMAKDGDKIVFGGYGTGPAGSYLLVLVTTKEDFEEERAAYDKWYASVKLGPITDAPKDWEMYRAKDYGFQMIVPKGTKTAEKEDGAWGGLKAEHDGVHFYGLAYKGEASAEEIEKVGIKLTELNASNWKVVDKGEDRRGCRWYRTVMAEEDGNVYLGIYGVGSKASFLMVLVAKKDDFRKHERAFRTWYASVLVD